MERLLLISSDYQPSYGGIGIHTKNLIAELNKQNIKITLLVARMKVAENYKYPSEAFYQEILNTEKLKVVEINTDFVNLLSREEIQLLEKMEEKDSFDYYCGILNQLFIKGAIKYLNDSDDTYNLIHLHDAFVSFGAVLISKYLNIPIVSTIHSMNSEEEWLIDNMRRYLVNNVDKIICVSDYIRNEIKKRFLFYEDSKLITIYNSVNFEIKLREIPIKKNGKIVFCGRLEHVKGVDILIKAFADLQNMEAKLIIIGSGSEEDSLKRICTDLNISKKVEFTGQIPHNKVLEYFDDANCVVLPSRKEPFATTALEAMSRGCCVVASDVGGFLELIDNEENGLLFENENALDLKEKLLYVLDHIDKANEMGIKAQQIVSSEYLWENTAKKVATVYQQFDK